jgi:hypothetical protein
VWHAGDSQAGHFGTYDATHTAAFAAAVADVQYIGLSFGGGCFFANGVGVAPAKAVEGCTKKAART